LLNKTKKYKDREKDKGSISINASNKKKFPKIIRVISLKGRRSYYINPLAYLYF